MRDTKDLAYCSLVYEGHAKALVVALFLLVGGRARFPDRSLLCDRLPGKRGPVENECVLSRDQAGRQFANYSALSPSPLFVRGLCQVHSEHPQSQVSAA